MHYSTDYFHTPEKAHEFSLFFESCAFSSILCVTYKTIFVITQPSTIPRGVGLQKQAQPETYGRQDAF